jgi:hypothetical protein
MSGETGEAQDEPDRRALSDPDQRACVICGRSGAAGSIRLPASEKHPDRMYEFFIHAECLKRVAKPGFAGVEKL